MARASEETLLPLDTFARIFNINPLHFNQVQVDTLAMSKVCDSPLIQYAWQDADRAGREEIALAISEAEDLIAQAVGFKLLPTWENDKEISWHRPAIPELIATSIRDVRGFNSSIQTRWKKILYGGIEGKTLVGVAVPIVYSDSDGDGYTETATMMVGTTVTDPEEIRIFYSGQSGERTYEIRPITVTIAGGIATITCRREQLVLLDLQESLDPNAVDGLVDGNFLTGVDVYRIYNDPSSQAHFNWHDGGTCGTCYACTKSYQEACLSVDNSEVGYVRPTPATWNVITQEFDGADLNACRAPDSITLWYRAGHTYRDSVVKMDPIWQRSVAYLAATLLHRPLCACASVTTYMDYWQEDLALRMSSQTSSNSFNINNKLFDNPFGTRRGAIYAWRYAQRYLGGSVNA